MRPPPPPAQIPKDDARLRAWRAAGALGDRAAGRTVVAASLTLDCAWAAVLAAVRAHTEAAGGAFEDSVEGRPARATRTLVEGDFERAGPVRKLRAGAVRGVRRCSAFPAAVSYHAFSKKFQTQYF